MPARRGLIHRRCGGWSYSRIHNPTALVFRQGEDRIQIDLADFWNRFDELGHAQQHLHNCLEINGRPTTIAGE